MAEQHTATPAADRPARDFPAAWGSMTREELLAERNRISDAEPAGSLAAARQSELIAELSRRLHGTPATLDVAAIPVPDIDLPPEGMYRRGFWAGWHAARGAEG